MLFLLRFKHYCVRFAFFTLLLLISEIQVSGQSHTEYFSGQNGIKSASFESYKTGFLRNEQAMYSPSLSETDTSKLMQKLYGVNTFMEWYMKYFPVPYGSYSEETS